MTTIRLPCYGIKVDTDGICGSIISELDKEFDGITSLILGHAIAGVDIQSSAYIEGIESAIDAVANNLEN